MTKIAFWKIGALGDVLMTTPLLRQVRKALPHAQIDYIVGQSCAVILAGNPDVDRVVPFDESILYRRKLLKAGSIVRLLGGYDAVFVLDKHWVFALLARLANIPVRIGFARRPLDGFFLTRKVFYGPVQHEIAYYLALATAFGLPVDQTDVALTQSCAMAPVVEQPYTVLINGGGANANEESTVRRMPEPLFSELVTAYLAKGTVVFLGASAESKYYEKFSCAGTVNLCGQTSVQEALGVLKHAQSIFSTDTGLMHMAGAVNPRLTAVFGPTHPGRKCPHGARWAWTDQDIYDERYELYGELPHLKFFQRMRLADITRASAVGERIIDQE